MTVDNFPRHRGWAHEGNSRTNKFKITYIYLLLKHIKELLSELSNSFDNFYRVWKNWTILKSDQTFLCKTEPRWFFFFLLLLLLDEATGYWSNSCCFCHFPKTQEKKQVVENLLLSRIQSSHHFQMCLDFFFFTLVDTAQIPTRHRQNVTHPGRGGVH